MRTARSWNRIDSVDEMNNGLLAWEHEQTLHEQHR